MATTDGWRPAGGEGETTCAWVETTGVEVTLVNLALSAVLFFFFFLGEGEGKVMQGQSWSRRKFEYLAWEAAEHGLICDGFATLATELTS